MSIYRSTGCLWWPLVVLCEDQIIVFLWLELPLLSLSRVCVCVCVCVKMGAWLDLETRNSNLYLGISAADLIYKLKTLPLYSSAIPIICFHNWTDSLGGFIGCKNAPYVKFSIYFMVNFCSFVLSVSLSIVLFYSASSLLQTNTKSYSISGWTYLDDIFFQWREIIDFLKN